MSSPPPTGDQSSNNVSASTTEDNPVTNNDQTATTAPSIPNLTPSHDTPSAEGNHSQSVPPPPLPQVPWRGEIPNFFVVGPGGNLMPHFHPHPFSQNAPAPTTQDAIGDAPISAGPMPSRPNMRFPNPMFSFFMPLPMGPSERRPDPEAAAELLRAMPGVSKGLLRRVDRVTRAEQVKDGETDEENKGWKCGICLEGPEGDVKDTGVKVLPCNHLFHGACLEPWFTTNHTCPTCRLDLDPGKTLRNNTRQPFGRPRATGAARQPPHPYSREASRSGTPTPAGSESAAPLPPILASMEDAPNNFTFMWQMPNNHAPRPHTPTPSTPPPQTTQQAGPPVEAPSTPTLHFDVSLTASPAPMERDPTANHDQAFPPPNMPNILDSMLDMAMGMGGQRPAGQQGQNIPPLPHHHHHHPVPIHHHHHLPFPPFHVHNRAHHHHHLRPPGLSTPFPARTSPEPEVAPADNNTPTEEIIPISVPPTNAEETASPATNEGASTDANNVAPVAPVPPAAVANNTTHFHVFFGVGDQPPTGMPSMTMPHMPPQELVRPPGPPPVPVERPSLDAWVEGRERLLGWRCDAPECGVAPTNDDDDDSPMSFEGDIEMVSIYSGLQPISLATDDGEVKGGFEIHACEHRWHRTCLETVERVSGRSVLPDGEGRVWVKCEKCRKDGWIKPRGRSTSEGEVEKLCAA